MGEQIPGWNSFEGWLWWRDRARKDLLFLCNYVLGYEDVSYAVHGNIIGNLQQLPGGKDNVKIPPNAPTPKPGKYWLPDPKSIIANYKPNVPLWDLKGARKFLNMIPRGHLKSSVITVAHSIQWVINYPDIRICLDSHTVDGVEGFLSSVRRHFTSNEKFRYLFPEHTPHGKEADKFGNQSFFDTKARTNWAAKEHTYNTMSIGGAKAGPHYDVVFHDDLVDSNNVITPGLIASVKKHMADCEPLVDKNTTSWGEARRGWEYLTGTFYDYSDLNYSVYEEEKARLSKKEYEEYEAIKGDKQAVQARFGTDRKLERRSWAINVQSAAPNYPEGPTLWPERYPIEMLRQMERDPAIGPALLAAQYLMNPIPPNSGLVDSIDEIKFIPRRELDGLYPYLRLHVTVDLAGMEPNSQGADNDYTVINLSGFGKAGQIFVIELFRSRYRPNEVIDILFDLYKRHPRIVDFKIEKDAHMRVLGHFLRREMSRRNVWLPLVEIKRDNRTSKQQRIKGLQPWIKNGTMRFADDLPQKKAVIDEVMRFPKYAHDDVLDTCADQLQNKEGGVEGDVMGRSAEAPILVGTQPVYKFVGFDQVGAERWLISQFGRQDDTKSEDLDPMTGF